MVGLLPTSLLVVVYFGSLMLHMNIELEVVCRARGEYDSYSCREIQHVDVVAVIPRRVLPPERSGFISVKSRRRWTASGT
jgi:hypothetical protein